VNCTLCLAPITWQSGWPACNCDCDPKLMLTVRQAAQFMHMSPSGIYHMIDDGYLHADKSRRPIRVAMVILKAYLAGDHAYFTYTRQNGHAGRP
jgi:hypothetical protein